MTFLTPDPARFMTPDPDRIGALADDLAADGEAELSEIVRQVADDVRKAAPGPGQAEPSAATSASASAGVL